MMKVKTLALPTLALAALLVTPASWGADKVLAKVNGTPITQSMVDDYQRQHANGRQGEMNEDRALDELIGREMVYQDAVRQKLDKSPEVVKQLDQIRKQLMLNAALEKAVGSREITDEMLKKEYDEQISKYHVKEYKASHILVKSESEAKAIIGELDKGGDFAKLAEKYSTDDGSKKEGGELGWFGPGQMVPQFFTATQSLAKGSYTKTPVQTPYGWHVIKLEDTRNAQPPEFDKVKGQMRALIQQQYVNEYVDSLKAKAKIVKP